LEPEISTYNLDRYPDEPEDREMGEISQSEAEDLASSGNEQLVELRGLKTRVHPDNSKTFCVLAADLEDDEPILLDSEPGDYNDPESDCLNLGRFDRSANVPVEQRSKNTVRDKIEALMKLKPGDKFYIYKKTLNSYVEELPAGYDIPLVNVGTQRYLYKDDDR